MPAESNDDHRGAEIRSTFTDVMCDTEDTVVRSELTLGKPLCQGDDTRCRAHALEHAVDRPKHDEDPGRIAHTEDGIDDSCAEQAERHDLLDIAVVGDKAVCAFADGDGDEHACAHHAEFRRRKAVLEHRLLRDTECHAHDIVHAIAEDHGRDSLNARCMIHLLDHSLILDTRLIRSSQKPFQHFLHLTFPMKSNFDYSFFSRLSGKDWIFCDISV